MARLTDFHRQHSTTLVDRCVIRDTSSSTVGAGLWFLSAGSPTVISFPLVNGVGWWNLLRGPRIQLSAYTILHDKYSTTLLEELTS
jgi:hypothetical protein